MAFTLEKTIATGQQLLVRFNAIKALSDNISEDETNLSIFLAASEHVAHLYNEFQEINKKTLIDSSSDQWPVLCKLVTNIDMIFFQIEALKLRLGSKPNSRKSRSNSNESLVSEKAKSEPNLSFNSASVKDDSIRQPNVKLPKIKLPSFDGSLKDWSAYFDLFTALIHNNDSLTNVEKFQYLISTLSKDPLSLVKHLPVTSENYSIAFDLLVDRYQNDRVLSTYYWSNIFNAPKISTSDSPQALRNLLNIFIENSTALEQYTKVNLWDFTLLNLLLQKLDSVTRKSFELRCASWDSPTFVDLKQFLLDQCKALEASALNNQTSTSRPHCPKPIFSSVPKRPHTFVASTEKGSKSCANCRKHHFILECSSFLAMSPFKRYEIAKSAGLCLKCLESAHSVKDCKASVGCTKCSYSHHSLLHFAKPTRTSQDAPRPTGINNSSLEGEPSNNLTSLSSVTTSSSKCNTVLLATVQLEICDKWGTFHTVRALIDSGSQASFLTDSWRKRLGLPMSKSSVPVSCLGHVTLNACSGLVNCRIRPVGVAASIFDIQTVVLPTICDKLPNVKITPSNSIPNLRLADPSWYIPGCIDMLLGADIFSKIIRDGFLPSKNNCPMAMNTIFGWILLGTVSSSSADSLHSFFVVSEPSIDESIKAFWKVEEVPSKEHSSPEDDQAELSFVSSHFRLDNGRFGISLPFKNSKSLPSFQGSLEIADRRLAALERRLSHQPEIRDLYKDFMREYLVSGHMSLCQEFVPEGSYFIPHHCVVKDDPNGRKIRVVFDASAKDLNGVSLNDTLLVGPKLQNDIVEILLRFRLFQFVFTCDIRQMYRQILVVEPQRFFQLIRWRFSSEETVQTYTLNTVTYGVSSSPYLAIRCLLQLAREHKQLFPLAAQAIEQHLYVDDFAAGSDDLSSVLELKRQLICLLSLGRFELRKWSANHPSILEDIPVEHCQSGVSTFDVNKDLMSVKILGLQWLSSSDSFSFTVKDTHSDCTKRTILSEIARIYDPLGFLCPLTFFAKHLIQILWSLGLDWDDKPPDSICQKWELYKSSLSRLSSLSIPRYMRIPSFVSCQLHAFGDASEAGYACVLYFRFVDHEGNIVVSFVMAKSKVAPLKRLSIPRLELCAAVLLSNLVSFVLTTCSSISIDKVFAWSDSLVALSWIRSSPHKWKTFVANRVAHIQERVPPQSWFYISSGDNPADVASRGLLPSDLVDFTPWWAGPAFLKLPAGSWPQPLVSVPPLDLVEFEDRKVTLLGQIEELIEVDSLLTRFSSLRKIQGIIAYCLRFVDGCKGGRRESLALDEFELHRALMTIVRSVQSVVFKPVLMQLRKGQPCPKHIQKLSPFLDEEGVLRVGGRLSHSSLPFETKHPALLPRTHRLSELIIRQTHQRFHHPGVNTTLYLLQQNFWILSARKLVRHCLSKCYRCFRSKPLSLQPPMADLPKFRVSQLKPFSSVGVDYGGPFCISLSRHRGSKIGKAYLCLFVCCATRALHLEIASDLSKDTFLAALRRFISRRGRCSHIYSDCGTNFVGAYREINSLMKSSADTEAIAWHFNPPSSPHFGGLWESGIKSVKTHISRVIGNQVLTFEEFNTLCCQIEAVLNSRPLCELSSDPNDLSVLTPGHFLTLEPLSSLPDPDLSHLSINRLSRWQFIQKLHQDFWKRWKAEYLHNFYQRSKWAKGESLSQLDIGSLVLIKDDGTPPLKWTLGRIEQLHPGADGIARVASVRTLNGLLKRPIIKLCLLPKQQN